MKGLLRSQGAGLPAMKKIGKPAVLLLICILTMALNRRYGWSGYITDPDTLTTLRSMIGENYVVASLAYLAATSVGCVLLALPGVAFAVIGGILFGPVMGTLLCLVAATAGAVLAFLAGRFFLKDSVKPMLEKSPLLNRLLFDDAGRSAVLLLLVTRLLPVFPYNIQNFAYGVTDIALLPYTLYTFLFMAPGVALFTVATAGLVSEENRRCLFVCAGALAVLVVTLGIFLYRRFLKCDAPVADEGRSGAGI